MKITKGVYSVGGMGKAIRAKVTIERLDDDVIVTRNHQKLISYPASDFNNLTYAEFFGRHPGFAEVANAFYGERVTNSMISEFYDEMSKFA